jgi:uncharacterized NAD(P)/FAD-binding protein YdhS
MKRISVTIIGMGPRGLSVFERIAAFAREHAGLLQLNLIDPSFCGPGVHATRQPQHLLINTLASQVTIFPTPGTVDLAPACVTPSLTEWARAQGYRRFGSEFHRAEPGPDAAGSDITDSDYLPRQLLGRYLSWAFNAIAASVPPSVTVNHLRHRAIDMFQQPDGSFMVELDSGFSIASDYVFLATGHSSNNLTDEEAWLRKFAQDHARYNSRLRYVRQVYPLDKLSGIGQDAQVGIQGLGLSAHDVIAELTVGRGGRFEQAGPGLRYVASGQEPQLTVFSRNCLPAASRGINQKGIAGRHQAQFFTRDAIRDLRVQAMRHRGSAQLDFDREVLPLLMKEMGFAYRCAEDLQAPDPVWYNLGDCERRAIEQLLFPLRGRSFAQPADFAAFFRAHLEADLAEALRGNAASPLKAAADVLRDARAVLQDCVEHAGLQAGSHRKFLSVYNPAINRVTFGPPLMRNQQLLALMDAGVLRVADGPNPLVRIDEERSQFALHCRFDSGPSVAYLDALVVARLDVFSPETDDTIFMRNLLKRGIIRPYYNGAFHPGGLDIDVDNHPLNRAGAPIGNLWALGYLTEGAQYYTHALPRPGLQSRQVLDADRCVKALFAAIATPELVKAGLRLRTVPVERRQATSQV